jgi:hypothetical protein
MDDFKWQRPELETRMYFLVPYNISSIQQGIQSGHAMGEYLLKYAHMNPHHVAWQYLAYHKTWIILNGGTTNSGHTGAAPGTMQEHYENLREHGIELATFNEPDLNSALSAIAFIVDERVWDYEKYPDFNLYMKNQLGVVPYCETFKNGPWTYDEMKVKFPTQFAEWSKTMGGDKNIFLREFLRHKKLA